MIHEKITQNLLHCMYKWNPTYIMQLHREGGKGLGLFDRYLQRTEATEGDVLIW